MEKQANITDIVTDYIKVHLENGDWPIGTKIPSENDLCKATGASRTSVRAALQRFNTLGILQSQHGRGTFVCGNDLHLLGANSAAALNVSITEPDKYTLIEWHQARNLLEPEIAYRCAENATPELIEKLRKNCEEQRNLVGQQEAFIAKDMEFHLILADFMGNRLISDIMRQLLDCPDIHKKNNEEFGYYGGVHFHMLIADAISSHDAKRARNLMAEHGREANIRFNIDHFAKVEL